MTHRVLPPPAGATGNPITLGGIVYRCAQGAALDVPDHIADLLCANGWMRGADTGVAATTGRPKSPKIGQTFVDSTIGVVIKWNGKAWINPVTGANV